MASLTTIFTSGGTVLLLERDGHINAPMTWFLNSEYDNPHTQGDVIAGLRILHRHLSVYNVDLPARALTGHCLLAVERESLIKMAFLALPDLDGMSDPMLKRITSKTLSDPSQLRNANQHGTAHKRLSASSGFLTYYRDRLLIDAIRSPSQRQAMKDAYDDTIKHLSSAVANPARSQRDIRSMPTKGYLEIIRQVVVNPDRLFLTAGGKPSSFPLRNRAMTLLAAEGLRPGAIGNVARADFRYRPGDSSGYLMVVDNTHRRTGHSTRGTPVAKGISSTKVEYNSEITLKLWPFTCIAIQEYLDVERENELSKVFGNPSNGFMFLKSGGKPISDRSTISTVFSELGNRLEELAFLDVAKNDPFTNKSKYDFHAYLLRHSAATFYVSSRRHDPGFLDEMKFRFGWTATSTMPQTYADRAFSEAAGVDMDKFCQELKQLLAEKRKARNLDASGS